MKGAAAPLLLPLSIPAFAFRRAAMGARDVSGADFTARFAGAAGRKRWPAR